MITYIFDNLSISYVTCLPSAIGSDDYNPAFTCSKSTMETPEHCVKYVQS